MLSAAGAAVVPSSYLQCNGRDHLMAAGAAVLTWSKVSRIDPGKQGPLIYTPYIPAVVAGSMGRCRCMQVRTPNRPSIGRSRELFCARAGEVLPSR